MITSSQKMGVASSFMGKGMFQSKQASDFISGTLYDQFIKKDIKNFDDFHIAVLDIFNSLNSALPSKHYDVPSRKDIEEIFTKWTKLAKDQKKDEFIDFMMKYVNQNKPDGAMIIAGIVAPPGAMVAKRAGESVGQLNMIKAIPDVVFVPSATMLVLVAVKFYKRIFMGVSS
ncbi:hypothetical protein F2P56_010531 [Juglans regia]|uniref:Uncharacterized protein LOC108987772 n=2 Tax=Juglans regia TaxID=51240 RepID=A0A2I4EAA3_JUGRE|nr:uncharacterized protein LOC108987772 [Juglans regia]KAF5469977.1 hypothetical protein F2P56_010531 [Juglans regia]